MTGEPVVAILRSLERYYDAEAEHIGDYLRADDDPSAREVLHVRQDEDALSIEVVLPRRVAEAPWSDLSLDERCQRIEGVSHFLVLCARARAERQTTQLELEIQAEVDKWLVLSRGGRLRPDDDLRLRHALYEDVSFAHDARSVEGERYRLASRLAARFTRKLAETYARPGRLRAMRAALADFFHRGQREKLALIEAA
jgi:hypothetical protein